MASDRLEYIFDLIKGKDTLTPAFKQLQDDVTDAAKTIAKLGAVAFTALGAAVTGAVMAASKFEDVGVQFEILTGSVDRATSALSQLKEFSARTPFQFPDIAQAGKQLLGFGFQVEQLTPMLQNIGDVAAASGRPIQEMSLIFGQVAAAGKLTGERLLQFQERAIPIGPALAKTLGVAETSIRELVATGKVDFPIFQEAFQSMSNQGGFAFGGLARLSETLSGKISTLKDNFTLTAAKIGDKFLPVVKLVVSSMINLIEEVGRSKGLFDFISRSLAYVIDLFPELIRALDNAIKGFKILGEVINIIGSSIVTALLGPFALLEVSINALIEKVPFLGEKIGKISLGMETLFEASKNSAAKSVEEIQKIIDDDSMLGKLASKVERAVAPVSQSLRDSVSQSVDKGIVKGIKAASVKAKSQDFSLLGSLKNFEEFIKKAFKNANFVEAFDLGKMGPMFAQGLANGAEGAKSVVKGVMVAGATAMFGPLGQAVGPIMDLLMMSSDKLKQTIRDFFAAIPVLIKTIIDNIPVLLVALIDAIPVLVEGLMTVLIEKGTDPFFWTKIMLAMASAWLRMLPTLATSLFNGIKNGLTDGILQSFKDAFSSLGNLWKQIFSFDGGGRGAVEKFLGFDFPFIAFAQGGKVGGNARVNGDSLKNDVVPALLSPGELVIPRSVVSDGTVGGVIDFMQKSGVPVKNFFLGSIVESVSNAVSDAVSAASDIVSGAYGAITGAGSALLEGDLSGLMEQITDLITTVTLPPSLREILRSLLRIGAKVNPIDLVKDPMGTIVNAVKGAADFFKPSFMKLLKPIPLATGGMLRVPGISGGDSYPAMLAPGELVVDRSTSAGLRNFLSSDASGSSTSALLKQILDTLNKPQQVSTSIVINNEVFANMILELNRRNGRLTV